MLTGISAPALPLPRAPAGIDSLTTAPATTGLSGATSPRFDEILWRSINEVSQMDSASQSAIAESISGGEITQAEALTAMRKADLALRMTIQIRNKLVDAYREIQQMRM
jgi:flagellar hook-basal body complex protein FliE